MQNSLYYVKKVLEKYNKECICLVLSLCVVILSFISFHSILVQADTVPTFVCLSPDCNATNTPTFTPTFASSQQQVHSQLEAPTDAAVSHDQAASIAPTVSQAITGTIEPTTIPTTPTPTGLATDLHNTTVDASVSGSILVGIDNLQSLIELLLAILIPICCLPFLIKFLLSLFGGGMPAPIPATPASDSDESDEWDLKHEQELSQQNDGHNSGPLQNPVHESQTDLKNLSEPPQPEVKEQPHTMEHVQDVSNVKLPPLTGGQQENKVEGIIQDPLKK